MSWIKVVFCVTDFNFIQNVYFKTHINYWYFKSLLSGIYY